MAIDNIIYKDVKQGIIKNNIAKKEVENKKIKVIVEEEFIAIKIKDNWQLNKIDAYRFNLKRFVNGKALIKDNKIYIASESNILGIIVLEEKNDQINYNYGTIELPYKLKDFEMMENKSILILDDNGYIFLGVYKSFAKIKGKKKGVVFEDGACFIKDNEIHVLIDGERAVIKQKTSARFSIVKSKYRWLIVGMVAIKLDNPRRFEYTKFEY